MSYPSASQGFGGEKFKTREVPARIFAKAAAELFVNLQR